MNKPSTFYIETWGCQMNVLDSEKIAGLLLSEGFSEAKTPDDSDIILLNTCTVRDKAAVKVYTRLGELKPIKEERGAVLGVVGCLAQAEKRELFSRAPYIDLIVGPRGLKNIPHLIDQAKYQRVIDTELHEDSIIFPDTLISRKSPFKAYVTIMEGCNKRCSYCIVPFTRGIEVYRSLEDIVEEIKRLIGRGYLEIELLGQNVNSWRKNSLKFVDLLERVSGIEGLYRLRFTTPHPHHYSNEITDLISERRVFSRLLHLPVQSGSNRILKLMKRQYTREEYLEKVFYIKERIPDIALSSDFIVGFPGETDEDFEETLDLIKKVRFDSTFSFRYSKRKGTPAADSREQVTLPVMRLRHDMLLEMQSEIQAEIYSFYLGRIVDVLVEGLPKRGDGFCGRIDTNKIVNFKSRDKILPGAIVQVKITHAGQNSLMGELSKKCN